MADNEVSNEAQVIEPEATIAEATEQQVAESESDGDAPTSEVKEPARVRPRDRTPSGLIAAIISGLGFIIIAIAWIVLSARRMLRSRKGG